MCFELYINLGSRLDQDHMFRQVYHMLKHIVEDDLTKEYDEAFLCDTISIFLDSCCLSKVKDAKLSKLVRIVVIFLLKLKSFH